ncbi:methyltransferase type 12 [Ectocarpus siliculosus]|uniref:Methyltransferase type 12 n=1 Tax=Ectocarpus siliculosus TaxID=2880 RepID=D8LRQ6_ECTSI|nr:methyltransferase type 12 [Ectocarpus siliculosus]|eukprot:CBN73823.1 methyltransferase type 12 [Ectocarpus siliculosus]
MQECVDTLTEKSKAGNEMVSNLVQSLGSALVYPDAGNFDTNRKLWDNYAAEWEPDASWVQKMAQGSKTERLEVVGDEWSTRDDVMRVINDFILPNVTEESNVGEIGCGGGRVTVEVFRKAGQLTCFDISKNMLKRTRDAVGEGVCAGGGKVIFVLLSQPRLPENASDSLDFVILYDVLVHVDLHITNKYIREIARVLKPGGKAFLSTANFLSPGGWDRFNAQDKYSVGGFYFMCPDMVRLMLDKAGLRVVREGDHDPSNSYYNRDYLVLVQKPL